ncbi:MAG: penicillin-binding protein 1A [Burkholderiaceae bacterium]
MPSPSTSSSSVSQSGRVHVAWRILGWIVGLASAGALSLFLIFVVATALAYRNLPSIDSLTDYRPKIPLRVYTADGVLIGEFGDERRAIVSIGQVPTVMKQAILAAEDEHFYQHGGIDYVGVLRAAVNNLANGSFFGGGRKQGASTITQQIARNFFLSFEQSYIRKFYEALLTFKIEDNLTKDQILEVYINQIYLGQHAFGFGSAERVYYGKALKDVTTAEAAMLAGLPKAPSTNNPINNPKRARARQLYVLDRMRALGNLTDAQYAAARAEQSVVKVDAESFAVHAEYVAEMARQVVYDQFRDETYSRGLNVYTTLISGEQNVAYESLRSGVLDYERRHGYNGPEAFVDLPASDTDSELNEIVEDNLIEHPDSDDIVAAIVLEASTKQVRAARVDDIITISGEGLKFAAFSLGDKASQAKRLKRGAVIRVMKNAKGAWEIIQLPTVQAAFISANVRDGAVRALVGGFDYNRNKFNHVTQAWRQPGSSFKPFIYSAALERGFTPTTMVNDAPVHVDAGITGGQSWDPKNYDGRFEGPMTLRQALAKSKNMVSIRLLQAIGPKYVQGTLPRFGFDAAKHPAYLPMALGAGSVTAWQMAGAYSVFANGGYKINPYFISRIVDSNGKDLARVDKLVAGDEANRVIDARNAFITDSLLRTVARSGTAARITAALKRNDLAGKTGTTNDSHDAWFAGYSNDNIVGIAWIGFDQPKSLGDRETGGGLALPIWLGYMSKALKGVPEKERVMPQGVVNVGGEVYYVENQPGQGVPSLGLDDPVPSADDGKGSSSGPTRDDPPHQTDPTHPPSVTPVTPKYEDPRDRSFGT